MGRESFGAAFEPRFERDLQRVGEQGDEDVGFDSVIELMMDGVHGEIVFELFEGLLHFGKPSDGGRREIGCLQAGRSPTEPEEAKEPTGGSIASLRSPLGQPAAGYLPSVGSQGFAGSSWLMLGLKR